MLNINCYLRAHRDTFPFLLAWHGKRKPCFLASLCSISPTSATLALSCTPYWSVQARTMGGDFLRMNQSCIYEKRIKMYRDQQTSWPRTKVNKLFSPK